jgi:hypothetical protein
VFVPPDPFTIANLIVNDNTVLGSACGDTLTVNATATFNCNAFFNEDVDLGSDNLDNININGLAFFNSDVDVGASNFTITAATGDTVIGGWLQVAGVTTVVGNLNPLGDIYKVAASDLLISAAAGQCIELQTNGVTQLTVCAAGVTITDDLTVNGANINLGDACTDQLTVDALTFLNCDIIVGGGQLTIDATNGNTHTLGTLTVDGLITGTGGLDLENFDVLDTSGNTTIGGWLAVTGEIEGTGGLDLENFDVTDGTGDTVIQGTLSVTGATIDLGDACGDTLTVNATSNFLCNLAVVAAGPTNVFTIAAATGDTWTAGTLTAVGQIIGTGGLDLENFDVADDTGDLDIGGGAFTVSGADGAIVGHGGLDLENFDVANDTGDTVIEGTLTVNGATIDLGNACGDTLTVNATSNFLCNLAVVAAGPTNVFTVAVATGNTYTAGTLTAVGQIIGTGGLDLENFDVTDGTGDLDIGGGSFTVSGADGAIVGHGGLDLENFDVANDTGDTVIEGTLTVNGATIDLGDACTDQLTVNALADFLCDVDVGAGNFTIAAADGSLNIGPGMFTVAGASGNVYTAGDLNVGGDIWLGDSCASDTLYVNAAANFNCNVALGDAADDVITFNGTIAGSSPLVFEGTTGGALDNYETTFAITGPATSDQTITFLDMTGNVVVTGNTGTSGGQFIVVNGSNIPQYVAMGGDVAMNSAGVTDIQNATIGSNEIINGSITNDDVNAAAAIQLSKLIHGTAAGQIIVCDGSNVPQYVVMSGDATIDQTGAVTIAVGAIDSSMILNDTIVNADINSAAGILWSKMENLTSAHILVGSAGNVATDVAMSGDVHIDNAGVTTIQADAVGAAEIAADAVGASEIVANAVGASELNYTVVAVTVNAGVAAGSSAADPNLVGGEILGFYPTGNQDQFVDSVVLNGDGSVTITLAANATANNTFNVVVLWP